MEIRSAVIVFVLAFTGCVPPAQGPKVGDGGYLACPPGTDCRERHVALRDCSLERGPSPRACPYGKHPMRLSYPAMMGFGVRSRTFQYLAYETGVLPPGLSLYFGADVAGVLTPEGSRNQHGFAARCERRSLSVKTRNTA